MSSPGSPAGTHGPEAGAAAAVRAADLWRSAGLGLASVWAVILVLVVAIWLRVTFFERPGDEVAGYTQVILAPVAVIAAVLLGWMLVSTRSLYQRRDSGWDAIVVLGSLGVAGAAFLLLPGTFLDGAQARLGPGVLGLAVLGAVSVAIGVQGQLTWRRAAQALLDLRSLQGGPAPEGLEVEMLTGPSDPDPDADPGP